MERADLREYATDAIKFWEPWRILYNLTLAAVVIIYFAIRYPQSKSTLTVDFCLGLFMLALIANVAYCAAYVVDIFAAGIGILRGHRKTGQRWSLQNRPTEVARDLGCFTPTPPEEASLFSCANSVDRI